MSLATLTSSAGSLQLPVVAINYGLNSQIETAQVHRGVIFYPIKVIQDDFKFTVQYRSIRDYRAAQRFIHSALRQLTTQQYAGGAVMGGAMRFKWPEMAIDYQGFIKTAPMGAKKFEYAPRVDYVMVLVKDSIYGPGNGATNVPAFNDIYGNNTLASNATDRNPVLNPPGTAINPRPAVPGGLPGPGGAAGR